MKHAAAVAIGSSPVLTFGALQLLGSSQAPQWAAISDDLLDPRFWLTLAVMLISGAFGGFCYELLLRGGTMELPHRVRPNDGGPVYSHAPADTLIALGILGRALVGSAAAAAVLLVVAPSSAHAAIALGVTSGAAAPALIRLMRKQLLFAADAMARLKHGAPADETEHARVTRRHAAAPIPAPQAA